MNLVFPVLRFHYKWSDYERKQVRHMQDTFEELYPQYGWGSVGRKTHQGARLRHIPARLDHS